MRAVLRFAWHLLVVVKDLVLCFRRKKEKVDVTKKGKLRSEICHAEQPADGLPLTPVQHDQSPNRPLIKAE